MKLPELIACMPGAQVRGPTDVVVRSLCYDSRAVRPGDLFFAVKGGKFDGTAFIPDAIRKGAVGIVGDAVWSPDPNIAVIQVADLRDAMARAARHFHGEPDRQLKLLGISGTNGKTTTAFLARYLLECSGVRCGLMGTVRYELGERVLPALRTTPEACDFFRLLAGMVEAGCGAAAVEVSSHALAQERVGNAEFRVVAFTNLTRDHLDFHKTMEAYYLAKRRMFVRRVAGSVAVINADDAAGRRLLADPEVAGPKITYGAAGADIGWKFGGWTPEGGMVEFSKGGVSEKVMLPLLGDFNLSNAAAALGAATALGVDFAAAVRWLEKAPQVPGRLERVAGAKDFLVLVDYAHTDDALAKVLGVLKRLPHRRLVCVFGCGGDRDRTKRPLMGRAASELSDRVILTSDNPRSEEPGRIIEEIRAGVLAGAQVDVVEDRREAIRMAIRGAEAGDIVLIAGKGHEATQEIAGARFPFDDREVAAEMLRERCAS